MGIYDGAGIHGTDATSARSGPPPRTAASGWRSPTSSSSTTRCRCRRLCSFSSTLGRTPMSATATSSQPSSSREAWRGRGENRAGRSRSRGRGLEPSFSAPRRRRSRRRSGPAADARGARAARGRRPRPLRSAAACVATRPSSTLMKNPATAEDPSNAAEPGLSSILSAAWREQLGAFDRSLMTRGMAEKTRRAYGLDVGELAVWADGAGVSPDGVGHRVLRRYAAHLAAARREGGRALSHQTVARKLAAIRSFYGHMVERGDLDQNPADLVPSPRRPRGLPRAAARRRGRPAARPHPGPHAARDPRPRPVRARLLVRPAL